MCVCARAYGKAVSEADVARAFARLVSASGGLSRRARGYLPGWFFLGSAMLPLVLRLHSA